MFSNRLIFLRKTEDDILKEEELKKIVKNVQSATVAPVRPASAKKTAPPPPPPEHEEYKSLQEKILEQKTKLRQDRRPLSKVEEKKVTPVKRKPAPAVNRGSVRPNYHKGKSTEQVSNIPPTFPKPDTTVEKPAEPAPVPVNDAERGDRRNSRNPSSKIRSPAPKHSPKPEREDEPRFDSDNFTKSATAFNIGTNLSQSQLKVGDFDGASFTERILEKNNMKNFSGKVPPRALSSEERAFTQCTFRPQLSKCPRVYSHVQPKLLKHLESPVTERPPSAANASFVNQSFTHVAAEGLFSRRNPKGKVMGHSASTDRLGVSISGDFANVSSIGSLRSCFNSMKVSVFEKPNANFFDIKSNKKLGYILQHGYSFKHHEKKHYNTKKSVDEYRRAGQEFLNVTMQNRSVMESLCPAKIEPRSSGASLNMSASSQNLYADLFTDRYRKLTKSIIEDLKVSTPTPAPEKAAEEPTLVTEERVAEEFNNAKKNRMYKELGINLNLKEIFGGLGYNDLMKLKKLHVLYATQRGKAGGKPKEAVGKSES